MMAFSDFKTISDVQEKFRIRHLENDFVEGEEKKFILYDEILSGTPDYLISTRSELGKRVVGTPLIILVEAKKNDFEQG